LPLNCGLLFEELMNRGVDKVLVGHSMADGYAGLAAWALTVNLPNHGWARRAWRDRLFRREDEFASGAPHQLAAGFVRDLQVGVATAAAK
jgi:hypothetical protein